MRKVAEITVLTATLIATILSITGISITKSNTEDYRKEMSEDCSFGGSLCHRSTSNPYTMIGVDYICKHHIAEKLNNGEKVGQMGSKYKEPEEVMNNLYDHLTFYAMAENTLMVIPIFQAVAFIIFLLMFIVRLLSRDAEEFGENKLSLLFTFCQTTAVCALNASVFGLATIEVTFGNCLTSNCPEFMLSNITLAKFVYWSWFIGNSGLAISALFLLARYCCVKEEDGDGGATISFMTTIGLSIAALSALLLLISSLIGALIYFILWAYVSNLYIYIYIANTVHLVWGLYLILASILTIFISGIQINAYHRLKMYKYLNVGGYA